MGGIFSSQNLKSLHVINTEIPEEKIIKRMHTNEKGLEGCPQQCFSHFLLLVIFSLCSLYYCSVNSLNFVKHLWKKFR